MRDFGLVVIGAHFGVWLQEEILRYKSKNILLVEPVPYNYKVLKKNFEKKDNIFICTNAIFSENKIERFYFVKEDSISKLGKHWASGIGSFSKQHILNHKTKRFKIEENDIESIEIDFINFETLVNNYKIKSIDKLQIDVEGAEFNILNSNLAQFNSETGYGVVFPSWLQHWVPETKDERISISWNILIRGKYGEPNTLQNATI